MKAIVQDRYGSPEVLRLREIDKPRVDDDGVLVRVRAASVNALDWHFTRGDPAFPFWRSEARFGRGELAVGAPGNRAGRRPPHTRPRSIAPRGPGATASRPPRAARARATTAE